jgi:hypothetical protein
VALAALARDRFGAPHDVSGEVNVDDYPGDVTCAFCRTALSRRAAAVRVRMDCGEVFDLCDRCYQGHRLLELRGDVEALDSHLSLRAVVAQKAALLLIRNLVTASLDADDPANVRLMQQVAEMILAGGRG